MGDIALLLAVTVGNTNDNLHKFAHNNNRTLFNMEEDKLVAKVLVATDKDGMNNSIIMYSMKEPSGPFAIKRTQKFQWHMIFSLWKDILQQQYSLTIIASDNSSEPLKG